ncbi:hypothetical protein NP92_13030 [Anoxybacillus gonensis]|uniref:Phage protein n=1 Tax=Anoxybacillus gonensis TaxID=198467 RepID=A0AAW7TLB9_9BACL|nr:hypothetical protein [Anoxybacillus gonensis]AKS38543.1 hypothetical protein AFK25_08235 [Anoxybacillus gonensis]KGP59564.1 hypothetical protein NP92_13030 [Anoxybacillus gonensis]MCX8045930.1 hypothetical protein [Anoxybacillus gonensis]MDO0878381.1 hypothetical protein [Anoxybacillus gonensis]
MNKIQKAAHWVVSSIADDLRSNTISNVVGMATGGIGNGVRAYKAATTGFTMLERKVASETAKGTVAGYFAGSYVIGSMNKVAAVEKWFDNTKVGKAIDDGITKVENKLHKLIGGGRY